MLKESTKINSSHIRALVGKDIATKYPGASIQWINASTDINMRRIEALYFGQYRGLTGKKKCCKKRCFRPCK